MEYVTFYEKPEKSIYNISTRWIHGICTSFYVNVPGYSIYYYKNNTLDRV